MTEKPNETKDLKLYSQRAIGLATFLGGPMAAGYLIRSNFCALDEVQKGNNALIIGIFSTIVLFGGIFIIPEHIMDKVPNQVLPIVYIGIIYYIVKKIHGPLLDLHEELGNQFYSLWKAAGIGVISLLFILAGVFALIFLMPEDSNLVDYDKELEIFTANEESTLTFYDDYETKPRMELANNLSTVIIPKWKENIEIIEKTNALEGLPQELLDQNEFLYKYSLLRLETFELFEKAVMEDTDKYKFELDALHIKINDLLVANN